ncbi:MAG TPA: type II secretion system F family protein [Methylomirabilota bacterium]|nr:type II secretion system F family protein [Methylomirabilota bacterium]
MPPFIASIAADPALPFVFAGIVAVLAVGSVLISLQSASAHRAVQRRLRLDPPSSGRAAAGPREAGKPAARHAVASVTDRIVEKATVFARLSGPQATRQLKQRLVRAGFFDAGAVPAFFLGRAVGAVTGFAAAFLALDMVFTEVGGGAFWASLLGGTLIGYFLPNLYLRSRSKRVMMENRLGFPDFMDLMGVCANAGLSMEASLERVSRELAEMYPVLGVHLQILCLEVRAGRSLEDALHAMADRMDIAEVRAFATLLQQSKELGSSLSDALRVFSDDMRHKRLSMAEEKAYALPAKLSVPVSACILPVVLFIAILPVIVRFNVGID